MDKKREEKERQLISKYTTRFRKAQMTVAPKQELWKKLDMFDRGDQWKETSLPPWMPKPMANWIRYTRTLKRANLASSIPSAHYTAIDEEYAADIRRIQKAYVHVWQTEKVPRTIRRCIDRSLLQGTSVAVVYSDDSYTGGTYKGEGNPKNALYQGRICVKRYPIAQFFPDPDAFFIDDCSYVETTENVTLNSVRNNPKYQEYAGKRLQELTYDMLTHDSTEDGQIYDRDSGPGKSGMSSDGDEMVTVHAHWEQYINDDGENQIDVSYYIPNCQFILYKVEDIKPSMYPFAILNDEEEENDIFGTSTAMDILENQKIINRTAQTASTIAVLNQNPQKVVSRNSGINAQDLARTGTQPGKVWTTNDDPERSIVTVKPADIPKGLFEIEDRMKNDIREMVGINEAYTGQSVGSLTTSTGVNSLIERATIRDKDKMVQIDEFVERISNLIVLHILHKWQDKRPIVNETPNGKMEYSEYEPFDEGSIKNLQWVVKSDIYAVAPMTQALRKQQADNLMQMQGQFQFSPPIITVEEWLRFQDFDMKDQILDRMATDRARMEREKAMNYGQMIVQIAEVVRQNIAQGMPPQEAQQMAAQAAEQFLADQQKQELTNGRDPANQAQGPQGTTGQQAMMAMARGN